MRNGRWRSRSGRREKRELRGGGRVRRSGAQGDDASGRLPERGGAAAFAEAEDAFVGGADVGFGAGAVDFFESFAMRADEGEQALLPLRGGDRRKVDFPEIEILVKEGDAVGVMPVLGTDLADDADFGFLVALGPAEDELLLWGELMAGEDAGAVKAEEDGGGVLGKDFAAEVAPDEEDGDFLRNASAAAHNLWWQEWGQEGGSGGTI